MVGDFEEASIHALTQFTLSIFFHIRSLKLVIGLVETQQTPFFASPSFHSLKIQLKQKKSNTKFKIAHFLRQHSVTNDVFNACKTEHKYV